MGTTQTSRTSSASYPSSPCPLSGLNPAGFWLPLPPLLEPGHPLSATLYHTQTTALCSAGSSRSSAAFVNGTELNLPWNYLTWKYNTGSFLLCPTPTVTRHPALGSHNVGAGVMAQWIKELAVKPQNLGSNPPGEAHDGRRESAPQSCLLTSTCALWHAWWAGRQADRQADKCNLERKSGCLIFLDTISFR